MEGIAPIETLTDADVKGLLKRYIGKRHENGGIDPTLRFTSFDFCYTRFRRFVYTGKTTSIASPANLQENCMHLGFYLASWGMYRASSKILSKSARGLAPILDLLASLDPAMWELDIEGYSSGSLSQLAAVMEDLKTKLKTEVEVTPTDTLCTKILLGTLGCTPAFDVYFKAGSDLHSPSKTSFLRLQEFAEKHSGILRSQVASCVNFDDGSPTDIPYPTARLLDMVFYQRGLEWLAK